MVAWIIDNKNNLLSLRINKKAAFSQKKRAVSGTLKFNKKRQ
jgi:hypothetical protein